MNIYFWNFELNLKNVKNFKATIKNSEHWTEDDIYGIIEYSAIYSFSASMSASSRTLFNEWWKTKFQLNPTDGTVRKNS